MYSENGNIKWLGHYCEELIVLELRRYFTFFMCKLEYNSIIYIYYIHVYHMGVYMCASVYVRIMQL